MTDTTFPFGNGSAMAREWRCSFRACGSLSQCGLLYSPGEILNH